MTILIIFSIPRRAVSSPFGHKISDLNGGECLPMNSLPQRVPSIKLSDQATVYNSSLDVIRHFVQSNNWPEPGLLFHHLLLTHDPEAPFCL